MSNPMLRDMLEQVERVREDARHLMEGMTDEQANWSPGPARWSVAQCLEHLTLTVRLYPAKVEEMVRESRERERAGKRPWRNGWIAGFIIATMEPPPRMRVPTRPQAVPRSDLRAAEVAADFDAAHAELESMIMSADGVSLRHGRTGSPFAPRVRFTLEQVLRVNVAHARRHLWQARQVTREPGFPGPGGATAG